MRLHQGRRRGLGFDEFVRNVKARRPFFAARREAGMGVMNMAKRLFAFVPALASAPKLGENIRPDLPLIGRREKRHEALLVAKREALEAAFVSRHRGKHRSRAKR
ncbi:MAG: hypothetical protein ACREDM_15375 [Methylocella sp.]